MNIIESGFLNNMRIFKRLAQISGAVLRLTVGIGGAVLVFLALKDNVKQGASGKLKPKP